MGNAGRIAIAELPWTICLVIVWVLCILVCYLFFPVVVIAPAIYAYVANIILEGRFAKYMSPEDLEAEKERNSENW